MAGKKISEIRLRRLSHYAMCLRRARDAKTPTITSSYLSGRCGVSAAAVRKDLAAFGEFGKQGSGYAVEKLLSNIEEILGTTSPPPVLLVGAGNIGRALLESGFSGTGGYSFEGAFDTDSNVVGSSFGGVVVSPLRELPARIRALGDVICVLAVPPGQGQPAADRAADAGCRAILSFTLEPISVPPGVHLRYVEVSTELDMLTHMMKRRGS